MDNLQDQWWWKTMLFVLTAITGGSLGYIMRTKDKNLTVSYGRMFLEGFSAGFVGFLVMLVCNEMHLSDKYTGVIVGVTGWLGASASIKMLEKVVYKKLGLTKDTNYAPLQEETKNVDVPK